MKVFLTSAIAATLATAGLASAKPPLREVQDLNNRLYYGLVAYEISEACPGLSFRKLRGVNELWALGRAAKALGYTEAEIRAFIKSDEEKDLMRKRGEAWLKHKGVAVGDTEGYCTLGRAEIERNSAIGVYLRAK
ncbi:DUF5333 domain-containing protein [Shimia abyssi]|uniref:DUF5333 domain-containing protein n=1 Tax=Shimia abyssi TaxID=1662395 RepID=A0A2P8FJH5_9RHOB|nr:DUF5333 domain-containing protein [Shimia abyssi]PSL21855.1 hypothetical protein CLV88_101279 [Shimia abyssi]